MQAVLHGGEARTPGLSMKPGVEVLDRHVWCFAGAGATSKPTAAAEES